MGSASNYFDAGQTVGLDFTHVRQVDTKPTASSFDAGNIIYDRSEEAFYKTDGSTWVPFGIAADVVESFAEMKALNAAVGDIVYLELDYRRGFFYWDGSDLSTQVTNDPQHGIYVAPTSDATGASGAWVRQHDERFRPEWFGAVADGATDDIASINAAHDAVVALGHGLVEFSAKRTYVIGATLSWDISLVGLVGNGATIDASSLASGSAITFASSETVKPYNQAQLEFGGFELVGPGIASSVVGITVSGSSAAAAASHLQPSNININLFGTGVAFGDNAYIITFNRVDIFRCTQVIDYPSGLTNSGERIVWIGCTFYNSVNGVLANAVALMYFQNCSFDYITNKFLEARVGARLVLEGCFIEGTSDADYWLYAADSQSVIVLSNSFIFLAGSKTMALGHSANGDSGVFLNNVSIGAQTNYDAGVLFTGTGHARQVYPMNVVNGSTPTHEANNVLLFGGFEASSFRSEDWPTRSGTVPSLDTVEKHSGAKSLKIAPTVGNYVSFYGNFNIFPGDFPRLSFWLLTAFSGSTDELTITMQYYSRADTSVGSLPGPTNTFTASAAGTAPTGWTLFTLSPFVPAPGGADYVRVTVDYASSGSPSDGLGAVWLDDMVLTLE